MGAWRIPVSATMGHSNAIETVKSSLVHLQKATTPLSKDGRSRPEFVDIFGELKQEMEFANF
jgi:hypothetical protein